MNYRPWFVDTGYWIALFNVQDDFYARAQRFAATMSRPLVTTHAVLLEVGDAFAKGRWRPLGADFLEQVVSIPELEIIPITVDRLARASRLYAARPDKVWGLTDCVSFVVMQDRGLTEALAADHHFVQAGFRTLLLE